MNPRKTILLAAVAMTLGGGLLNLVAADGVAIAQPRRAAPPPQTTETRTEQLARDIERATSIRAAKELQYLYTQYQEFGMWDEMAALFSDNGEIVSDGVVIAKGKAAIADHLLTKLGGGKIGLPVGGLRTEILIQPVVTMSFDGRSARGRWTELTMSGEYGGEANWSGGMQINDYVKENGVWKIRRLHLYPQLAGKYETGFFATKPILPIVPYHYSPALAGRPVPDEAGDADRAPTGQTIAQIERRVTTLNDQDKVRNLQSVYGYYADRKMWSDVIDLFAEDGVLEIAGTGIWKGPKSVRRALEINGPEGLKRGEVFDQLQFGTIVTVDPNGVEARARGMQLGMLTPKLGEAFWSVSVFDNRYVKQNGVWRIREMRVYPKMKSDYFKGWSKSNIIDPKPARANAPDAPSASDNAPQFAPAIPVFDFPNPVSGQPVKYPAGAKVVGADRLVPAPAPSSASEPTGTPETRLAAARLKLNISKGYDAVENASGTLGYYLDDFLWDEYSQTLADNGTRPQSDGFYVGRDHSYRAMTQSHISHPSETNPRDAIRLHLRTQPVIDVNADGKSAKIRTRMFLYFANSVNAGAWNSGMYPNDTAVLEDGVWKMEIAGVIDETYFNSRNYKEGWANPPADGRRGPAPGEEGPAAPRSKWFNGITGGINFPPDIPWTMFSDFRRKDFSTTNWPEIKPMWFAYRNPVSGRTPPNYCPEILKCFGYR